MPAPYYLIVLNGRKTRGSVKAHQTLELAQIEAARLQAVCHGRFPVRILETHSELELKAQSQLETKAETSRLPISGPIIVIKKARRIAANVPPS